MDWGSTDIEHKQFRTRWMGLDRAEVELFVQQLTEQIQRLKVENSGLTKTMNEQEREIKEHKEREKAIRSVLLNAHRTTEQMKANAEKEAKLIVSEAELQAEKILQGAHQRLAQLHEDIAELKRHRIQLDMKLRSTLETYQQLLDMDRHDGDDESDQGAKVKYLNRPARAE